MNWADWAIIGVVGVSALIGIVRGFIKEALSLFIWLVAAVVAINFYVPASVWLVDVIEVASLRLLAAWVGLFVVTLLVGSVINYLLGKLVLATGLSGTDRLLGVLFGIARGLIVVLVILILLPQVLPVNEDQWWNESCLIPHFLEFESWARTMGNTLYESVKRLF